MEVKEEACRAGGRRLIEWGNGGENGRLRRQITWSAISVSLRRPSGEAEELGRRLSEIMGMKGKAWHECSDNFFLSVTIPSVEGLSFVFTEQYKALGCSCGCKSHL